MTHIYSRYKLENRIINAKLTIRAPLIILFIEIALELAAYVSSVEGILNTVFRLRFMIWSFGRSSNFDFNNPFG